MHNASKSHAFFTISQLQQSHNLGLKPQNLDAWTVFTVDWDVDPYLDKLLDASTVVRTSRFDWKAPTISTSTADGAEQFIALGCQDMLKATGEHRFKELAHAEMDLRKSTHLIDERSNSECPLPLLVGGAAFHQFNIDPTWNAFGSSQFILPHLILGKDASGCGYLRLIEPTNQADDSIRKLQQNETSEEDVRSIMRKRLEDLLMEYTEYVVETPLDESSIPYSKPLGQRIMESVIQHKEYWLSRFGHVIDSIHRSSLKKVVIARQTSIDGVSKQERIHLQRSLQERYQNCIHFSVEPTIDSGFFGATPERLLRLEGETLHIDALAGSRSRGRTENEDKALASELLRSEKDAEEHDIVKRQILEVLDPFSKQFRYPSSPFLKTLPNVQHLHTPIEAELEHTPSVFELIEQLHPTPAVGGYPKQKALEVIEQVEPQNRGWYAGIVGWVSEQGDADMAVSIRSASHMRDRLTLYAGCGLVEASIPEQEWDETYVKMTPFIEAAQDLSPIES